MLSSILDIEFNRHKYLQHWERINALVQGQDITPVTLELDVCSSCDHSCQWCVDPPGVHSNHMMPYAVAEKILTEAKELGVKGIVFKGGGESTLHPELAEIIQVAGELGFEVGLVTHGGHLDNPILLKSLVQYGAYVRISIDGPTAASRLDIHGRDDFDSLKKGIAALVSMRGPQRHPVIGASFCLDYVKRGLGVECIRLGEALGLDYVLIRPPFCEEVGFPAPFTHKEAALLREEIRNVATSYTGEMPVMVGNWIGDKEMEAFAQGKDTGLMARRDLSVKPFKYNGIEHLTKRCLASRLYMVITATRDVYGCCCLRGIEAFSFGRINYDEGLSLTTLIKNKKRAVSLAKMSRVECLAYCTHPMARINEMIEYLALPQKHHASFI